MTPKFLTIVDDKPAKEIKSKSNQVYNPSILGWCIKFLLKGLLPGTVTHIQHVTVSYKLQLHMVKFSTCIVIFIKKLLVTGYNVDKLLYPRPALFDNSVYAYVCILMIRGRFHHDIAITIID